MAEGMKTANQDMRTMKNNSSATLTVLHVPSTAKFNSAKKSCYRCGRNNHNEIECSFKDAKCHKCGEQGHVAIVC